MSIHEAQKPHWLKGLYFHSLSFCEEDSGRPVKGGGWREGEKGKRRLTVKGRSVSVEVYKHEPGVDGVVKGEIVYDGRIVHFGFQRDNNWMAGPRDCPGYLRHGHAQRNRGFDIKSRGGMLPSEREERRELLQTKLF